MQIDMKQPILDKNDQLASELRARFAENKVFVLDLLASPGSVSYTHLDVYKRQVVSPSGYISKMGVEGTMSDTGPYMMERSRKS